MQYFISFLEGMITFISPCLLPMLPIYISYFAGGKENDTKRVVKNALGFILGFTVVFVLLGALAGTLGGLLREHRAFVNVVTGVIVILFGMHFLGLFRLDLFKGMRMKSRDEMGFFSSMIFGIVFSIGWTPCVGAFLGTALSLAAQQAHVLEGMIMLLIYSLGLAIPFIVSALLIDYLKNAFNWIKKHYKVINVISGVFLIIIGFLMAIGKFEQLVGLFI